MRDGGQEDSRRRIISFSSEEPYQRWFGPEILDHSPAAVDLTRLNEVGVLLFNHNTNIVIGRVIRAWIEDSRGMAEVEFDTDEDAEKIFGKVKSGTLKTTSVRYIVDSWEEVAAGKKSADGRFTGPCSVARKWTPMEVSIVSVPADATVGVGRADDPEQGADLSIYEKQILVNKNLLHKEFFNMNIQEMIARQQAIVDGARAAGRALSAEESAEFDNLQRQIEDAQGNPPETPENPDINEAARQAVIAERQRVSDITALCRQAGMDPAEYISNGSDINAVRQAAVDHLIAHGAPVGGRMTGSEGDDFRQAAADAMLMRTGVEVQNPARGAEEMRGFSLRDMAIECLARDGVGTTTSLLRMSKDDLFNTVCRQFFNPTAAFPAILDNAIRKNIVQLYQTVPTTFQLWTTKGSVSDFKPTKDHSYLAGGAGDFLRVGENGELKADKPSTELLPQRQIDTYGRQFSMSRQAFINDDIGFITEIPGLYATSAKRTINKQVYKILVDNPAVFDGVALFDNAHNNLIATGAAPSVDTLQAIMLKLLSQKDPFGDSIMVEPEYLIVPVGYGFKMSQLLETALIDVTGIGSHTANALYNYRNKLKVVEEGALNVLAAGGAIPWFAVGNKNYAKSLQVDYLNGQETPTIRRSEVPGQLGFVWDIWLDWGITAVDFRGIAKNPGVALT